MPETNGKINGGAALSTLAKSGNQLVQLMIVAGMITNVILTKSSSNHTDTKVDTLREQVAAEVHQILTGQKQTKTKLGAIMQKLDVLPPPEPEAEEGD